MKTKTIWNPEEYITKCSKESSKLIADLKREGIETILSDNNNNIVFTKGNKEVKMSHHSFYRFSGMCMQRISDDSREGFKLGELTLSGYMEKIIKPIIKFRISK